MKKLFAVVLAIIVCMSLFCGCSSNSKTTDDSWKSKTWDQMSSKEKQKTYDHLKDKVEKSWY